MSESRVLVVTGTREDRADGDEQLQWFCDTFFFPARVMVGCARGIDLRTKLFFLRYGLKAEVFRAIWRQNNIYNHYAGHERNDKMIIAAPVDAHLLALPLWDRRGKALFWCDSGLHGIPDWKRCPGTRDCYNRGLAKGLQCHLR